MEGQRLGRLGARRDPWILSQPVIMLWGLFLRGKVSSSFSQTETSQKEYSQQTGAIRLAKSV